MKKLITSFLCLLSLIGFSQDLVQDGISFNIEYSDEEILQQGLKIGSEIPVSNLRGLDGFEFMKEEFEDKILVINFWFVGCRGCKQEEPYLRQVTNHFSKNSNIDFVSICMSSEGRIARYYEKNKSFGYRTISMNRKQVEQYFKVITSPTHWFYKNGKLVDKLISLFIQKKLRIG